MVNTLTTCPYCRQPIGQKELVSIREVEERKASEVRKQQEAELQTRVNERLTLERENLKKEHEEALKREQAKSGQQLNEVEKAKTSAEATVSQLQEQLNNLQTEVQEEITTKVTQEREKLKKEYEETTKQEQAELKAQLEQLEQAKSTIEAQTRDSQHELATLKSRFDQELDERLINEKNKVELEMTEKVERERKLSKNREEQMLKRVEELQRQLERTTPQERGGISEEQLEELLKNSFATDKIERIGRGRSGADVKQEVIWNGESCGLIIYECKDVQLWKNDFIEKLRKNRNELSADYAILVSTAFPAEEKHFCVVDDIPVIHPSAVAHLVRTVRNALIQMKRLDLTREESGEKFEDLLSYLSSPDFKNTMRGVTKSVDKLLVLQNKEKKQHEKTWKQQTTLFESINRDTIAVETKVEGILLSR